MPHTGVSILDEARRGIIYHHTSLTLRLLISSPLAPIACLSSSTELVAAEKSRVVDCGLGPFIRWVRGRLAIPATPRHLMGLVRGVDRRKPRTGMGLKHSRVMAAGRMKASAPPSPCRRLGWRLPGLDLA